MSNWKYFAPNGSIFRVEGKANNFRVAGRQTQFYRIVDPEMFFICCVFCLSLRVHTVIKIQSCSGIGIPV